MAKQKWVEIEFAQALGMATNPDNPGRKYAQRLLNVRTNDKPGKITLRPGYALKYPAPLDSTIANSSFLTFEMFMDKQAVPAGQEITCLIEKGTIQPLTGSGATYTQNALCFWIRPYWSGTAWVDDWQWLNKLIITEVTTAASPEAYPNECEIFGNAIQGLGTDTLVGWTVYNVATNQYAKIITSETDGSNTRICHTLYNSAWSLGDTVILMKNYYDLTCLAEIYNCDWTDIVFHKINDDLRIGFGGQENRTGISIGYRQKYSLIDKFGFTTIHPDLTSTALSNFKEMNRVVLDEFVTDTSGFGITLTTVAGATSKALTAGTWYVRLTATLDNYEEMLVAENSIVLNGSQDLQISPCMTLGKESSRITGLSIYVSGMADDDTTFYKYKSYDLTETSYTDSDGKAYPLLWTLNNNGQLILTTSLSANNSTVTTYSDELMTESNVTNIANETESFGSWEGETTSPQPVFQILDTTASPMVNLTPNVTFASLTPGYYDNAGLKQPPLTNADFCSDLIPVSGIGSNDTCEYVASDVDLIGGYYHLGCNDKRTTFSRSIHSFL